MVHWCVHLVCGDSISFSIFVVEEHSHSDVVSGFLEFGEAFHELCKGIGIFFFALAIALWSNGRLSVETLFGSSIFLIFTALTGIVGHVRAPICLAQGTTFLRPHLFGIR